MNTVTLTELRRNLESYLTQAQSGDVIITKYGREVARLVATADLQTNDQGASNTTTDISDEESGNAAGAAQDRRWLHIFN